MAELVREPATVVTWAPANAVHIKQRGFDHGELLARAVAKRLHLPVKELLTRQLDTAMTGRAAAARHVTLRPACPVSGSVLLVDDVVTTGATSSAAARALKSAGAIRVIVLAAAYTPAPGTNS
jgi:predicted amidophosphoribosyltransferase